MSRSPTNRAKCVETLPGEGGGKEESEGVAIAVGQRRRLVSLYFVCRMFTTIIATNKVGLADTLRKCSLILLSFPPPLTIASGPQVRGQQ